MQTITIQIGNTDDKLKQDEWSDFVGDIHMILEMMKERGLIDIHFYGSSLPFEWWQNAAWVITASDDKHIEFLRSRITEIRKRYQQESAAWTRGFTEFI